MKKTRPYIYQTRSDKGKKRRKKISLLGKDPFFIKGYLEEAKRKAKMTKKSKTGSPKSAKRKTFLASIRPKKRKTTKKRGKRKS